LAGQVRLLPAAPHALPVPERHFTHVWMIETLPRCRDPAAVLAETLRALRPGGTFALQDLVRAERAEPPPLPGWRPATTGERAPEGRVRRDRRARPHERSRRALAARRRRAGGARPPSRPGGEARPAPRPPRRGPRRARARRRGRRAARRADRRPARVGTGSRRAARVTPARG